MRLLLTCLLTAAFGCHSEPPVAEFHSARSNSPVRTGSEGRTELVTAELLCRLDAYPAGGEALLGLHLNIQPGWHLFWRGTNDTGLPLAIDWSLPDGVELGPLEWPTPERYVSPGDLLDHVYFDQLTILTTLRFPATMTEEELTIAAQLDWLVCADACLSGNARIELTLPVHPAGAATRAGPGASLIEAAQAAMPGDAPSDLIIDWSPHELRLTVPGAQGLAFFPRDDCLPFADLKARGETDGDTLQLSRDLGMSGGDRLTGILSVNHGSAKQVRTHRLDLTRPNDSL